jgi:hypothetical protein
MSQAPATPMSVMARFARTDTMVSIHQNHKGESSDQERYGSMRMGCYAM